MEDSFRRNGPSPSLQALFGIPPKILDTPTVKLLQDASPFAHVSPNLPPFLLIHGTADQSVDYPGSVIWKQALDALGVPCELITIPHGVHVEWNWDRMNPPQTAYKQQMVAWLQAVFARGPVAPMPATAPATREKVAGRWKIRQGSDPSGTIPCPPTGPANRSRRRRAPLTWSFDPATSLVHIEYPAGQGGTSPTRGSPCPTWPRDTRGQDRPCRRAAEGFVWADWRYFPARDLMISANGEIFDRTASGP